MNVNCQSCGAKYSIADNKVQGRRVKVRCKSCNTTIVVDGTTLTANSATTDDLSVEPKTMDGSLLSPFAQSDETWSVSVSDDDQREMTTQEVLASYRRGEFGESTFVWKDGMADWQPLLEVEAFQSLKEPQASTASVPRPKQTTVLGLGVSPFASPLSTQASAAAPQGQKTSAPIAATNPARGRAIDTKDLFGAASEADQELETAPMPPATASAAHEGATGARNENSVLFSLDALKRASSAPPPAPTKKDDPFGLGLGSGALGGLGGGGAAALFAPDAQALLTAPAAPPLAAAVPAFSATVPAFNVEPPKKKSPVIWALAAAGVLAAAVAVFALTGREATPEAEKSPAAGVDATDPKESPTDVARPDSVASASPSDEKPAEPPSATATPEPTAEAAAPAEPAIDKPSESKTPDTSTAPKAPASPPAAAAVAPRATSKPKAPEPPASGGSTFNVAAAKSALNAAAAQAPSCKKGGSGGKGRATVTFGPSGSVSSVSVSGVSGFMANCVSGVFKRARVPSFSGAPVTVAKSFNIPE